MYPDEQEVNNLKLEVGLLKKDNEVVMNITNKLSLTISSKNFTLVLISGWIKRMR